MALERIHRAIDTYPTVAVFGSVGLGALTAVALTALVFLGPRIPKVGSALGKLPLFKQANGAGEIARNFSIIGSSAIGGPLAGLGAVAVHRLTKPAEEAPADSPSEGPSSSTESD